jgi:hypothetical protein
MSKRPITGRQAVAQIIGPNGPVDVGTWDEVHIADADEFTEHKPLDGKTYQIYAGSSYGGTLKRGLYDHVLAKMIWDMQHPGTADPPRLILLVTDYFNDGTTSLRMYKEVVIMNRKEDTMRDKITEDLDWKAEDVEYL